MVEAQTNEGTWQFIFNKFIWPKECAITTHTILFYFFKKAYSIKDN